MAVTTITYAADSAITATAWHSLAADDWASSAAFDNETSANFVDVLVGGEIPAEATTLAAGESFDIYVSALYDTDVASGYGGGLGTGLTAGDSTLTEDTEFTPLNLTFLTSVRIEATAPDTTQDYIWGPVSIAQRFGGTMPQKFMLVLHNNTGSAIASTGAVVNAVGITYTST